MRKPSLLKRLRKYKIIRKYLRRKKIKELYAHSNWMVFDWGPNAKYFVKKGGISHEH